MPFELRSPLKFCLMFCRIYCLLAGSKYSAFMYSFSVHPWGICLPHSSCTMKHHLFFCFICLLYCGIEDRYSGLSWYRVTIRRRSLGKPVRSFSLSGFFSYLEEFKFSCQPAELFALEATLVMPRMNIRCYLPFQTSGRGLCKTN